MFDNLFSKKILGIDIGTSIIKLVELSRRAGKIRLENYGQIQSTAIYEKPFKVFEKNILLLSSEEISREIGSVIEETGIKTRKCIFSIPDFSSFFTSFELPPMTVEELYQAVEAEARRHVPLPLSEVTLDWQLIEGIPSDKKKSRLKILLVAVPNEIINQYKSIVSNLNLELVALEAEVFALARALTKHNEDSVALIDIGERSTTCSIIDKGVLKVSHSFDFSGSKLTEEISRSLSVDYQLAEQFKHLYGILLSPQNPEGNRIREILLPLVDSIIKESENIFKDFSLKEGKEIAKIVLAGGAVLLPGFLSYFQNHFKKETKVADPFSNIVYPQILDQKLKKMGPSYAIAVGLALRGLKKND